LKQPKVNRRKYRLSGTYSLRWSYPGIIFSGGPITREKDYFRSNENELALFDNFKKKYPEIEDKLGFFGGRGSISSRK